MVKSIATRRKKKTPLPRRVLTGYAAGPQEDFFKFKDYVRTDVEPKLIISTIKDYIRENYKKESKVLLSAPEWCFRYPYFIAATIEWKKLGKELPSNWIIERHINKFIDQLREKGEQQIQKSKDQPNVVRTSPQEILRQKSSDFIAEIEAVIDDFINGVWLDIDNYSPFLELKKIGAAQQIAKNAIDYYTPLKSELEDLISSKDKDLQEGYKHLTAKKKKEYLKLITHIIDDLEKYTQVKKAVRKPRVTKPKTADQQVKNLKFLKESAEYKIASIDPSQIIGCLRLYTFNVKTRVLTEYVSEHVDGIRVKGTTLQNINIEKSRCTRLRKPEEFLSIVLSKTPTQINKEWTKLTTKTNQPNARINDDTILLKIKG